MSTLLITGLCVFVVIGAGLGIAAAIALLRAPYRK
jgi:multisubunit Na+/H+ antiporter MnhG subunit